MAFDFVAEYRVLQPNASREVVTARTAAFDKLAKAVNGEFALVVDMAYFAYGLPFPAGNEAQQWFEGIVRAEDSVFTLAADKEEAARIATLVLKQRLANRFSATPVLVQAAAFAGKRQTLISTNCRRLLKGRSRAWCDVAAAQQRCFRWLLARRRQSTICSKKWKLATDPSPPSP